MVTTDFKAMLVEAYHAVGAFEPEIIYIYTDFRSFGTHAVGYASREDFCNIFVAPLIAAGKTVVIATFTYTTEGRFDVLSTPTRLGAINKWILGCDGMRRSEHPLFSYAALGPQSGLVENVGKSAFGQGSVFDRLQGKKAAFLHVGRPVTMGNTALHYVEHMCGATYRQNKAFRTEVFRSNDYVGTNYSAFLRRRDVAGESFEFDFSKAARMLDQKKLIRRVGNDDDLSSIACYWYDQTLDFLFDLFYRDPGIFIKSDFVQY